MKKERSPEEVLRGLIGSGFRGGQREIQRALEKNGIFVTQSTISRMLKQMGASRRREGGVNLYSIEDSSVELGSPLTQFRNLVIQVEGNEVLVVLRVVPGSALFVAGFLDHHCSDLILGTIAGDDTIFVAPRSTMDLPRVKKKIIGLIT